MFQPKSTPYQPTDFITDPSNPIAVSYRGPVFHVHYPFGLDDTSESVAWASLGYRMPKSFSNDYSEGFTLVVLGDIPEPFRNDLEHSGVSVREVKTRGDVINIDEVWRNPRVHV